MRGGASKCFDVNDNDPSSSPAADRGGGDLHRDSGESPDSAQIEAPVIPEFRLKVSTLWLPFRFMPLERKRSGFSLPRLLPGGSSPRLEGSQGRADSRRAHITNIKCSRFLSHSFAIRTHHVSEIARKSNNTWLTSRGLSFGVCLQDC